MRSEEPDFTVSHDPKDAPIFTHKAKIVKSPYVGDIVGIIDDDTKHYHFLKSWNNMEIDINNQWSVNNGTLGLEVCLHKDGKNKVEYMVRLPVKIAETILKTSLNAMAVCDEGKNILLHFKPLKVNQLFEFFILKKRTDAYVIDNNLSPRGWTLG